MIQAAQRRLRDDRFGGAWIDRTGHPFLGIAAVEPSQVDIDAIDVAGGEAGWSIEVVADRYSRAFLVGLVQAAHDPPSGDALVGIGWDPRFNRVQAQLQRWDIDAVSWLQDRFPEDALMIIVRPGMGAASTV